MFEKSKKLGVKYFVSEPDPSLLPMLDKLGQQYGMIVGLHGHDKKSSPNTWHPALVAKHCQAYLIGGRGVQRYGALDPFRTRPCRGRVDTEGPDRRLRNT